MKRTVTGPNGIMTVYGNAHLSDDDLRQMAASLTLENQVLIQTMRKELLTRYSVASRDDEEFGSDQNDAWDDMGAGVARAYRLGYGGMFKPAGKNVVIFTIENDKYKVNVEKSLKAMREQLTTRLRARGFRPTE